MRHFVSKNVLKKKQFLKGNDLDKIPCMGYNESKFVRKLTQSEKRIRTGGFTCIL